MVHWLISIPVPKTQQRQDVINKVSKKLQATKAPFWVFDIPTMKSNSQDSLYSLMDDLQKYDNSIENGVHRALKNLHDVTDFEKEEDFQPQIITEDGNGNSLKKPVNDSLPKFKWDENKFMLKKDFVQTTEKLYKTSVKLDDELKLKVDDYQLLRTNLSQIERKESGTILVRSLDGIITKDNFYESEMFISYYVVVNKQSYKDWLKEYVDLVDLYHKDAEETEKLRQKELEQRKKEQDERDKEKEREMGIKRPKEEKKKEEKKEEKVIEVKKPKDDKVPPPPVLPDSSVLIYEEGDFGIFTVIVLKIMAQDFKKACERFKYRLREFTYNEQRNELSKMEKDQLVKKKDEVKKELCQWCQTAFSELFLNWIHIKAIRVSVESVLRYGIPPNFVTFLIHPDGRERKIHGIFREECKDLINDDIDEKELIKNEFYPYILIPLNTHDPLFRFHF